MARGAGKSKADSACETGPERRCIATGESAPAAGLIRFVVGPDMQIVPDLAAKLPGRGIWVSADRAALDHAVAKKMFARAARQQVSVPEGLTDIVEAGMLRRVVELLALARKSGLAVAGYEKVRDMALRDEIAVLIQARDGSKRGKTKLRAPEGRGRYISCLDASELGLAFGREHVIHAALRAGGLAKRVVEEAARLDGLRAAIGGDAAGEDENDA